ncbi:hypothetical protein LTR10_021221 [Elasticomyces elasticus]|uniref:Myb-like domain-containing protein n=1 Tax=Exophiala sideris TaxID=1016849 RepID=A0ABR0J024_9EURO|nr:hypothetical protein LTR10_021221 [Elasticomyces elasticus]KAK5022347.1 hypothetical protein LTS07_010223 [Exophiala sideris]KAK5027159.1 hypothetical protein LTR13_009769 [Exophiala sideris]KAK5051734.1 hypothetical protein LTR69_010234 [Exophiala sideris]KAK5177699.1 hypothetical protein LTR44_009889 [Eurotiomycetes sp. CCFEE 6388]
MAPKQNKTPGAGNKRKRNSSTNPSTPASSTNTPNNAQGSRSNRPSNISRITREHRIDTFRQRLYPQVTTRRVIEVLLETNDGNVDAAYNQYMAARRAILANLGHPTATQVNASTSSDSDIETEEDAGEESDKQGENGETTAEQVQAQKETKKLLTETDIPFNANTEQERRDAAFTLREHVRESTLYTETLTRTEAILWNYLQEWDIATAQETFQNVNHVRRQLARIFDQMRTPLQRDVVHVKTAGTGSKPRKQAAVDPKEAETDANEEEEEVDDEATKAKRAADEELKRVSMAQDERLAEFINITGRPDWYSLLLTLQMHNWNLVGAVEHWYREGIPPYTGRPKRHTARLAADEGMRVGLNGKRMEKPSPEDCIPSNMEEVDDDQWRDEDDFFDPEEEGESDLSETPPPAATSQSNNERERDRKAGFALNTLTRLPHKGMPNPRRFVFEYIQNGTYRHNVFQHESFYFPERGEDENRPAKSKRQPRKPKDTPVPFDWNNGSHITKLTNWYRQNSIRVGGALRRGAHQTWSDAERQWLYDRMVELFQKTKLDHPKMSDDEIKKTMYVSDETKKAWEESYNNEFVGTQQPDGIRKARNAAALMTMRARDARICEEFKINPDKTYFARPKNRRNNERVGRREPRTAENDPYGQYEFTAAEDLDLEGYMRTTTFIEQVNFEHDAQLSLNDQTRWFWGRVLGAITEFYSTRQTVQDQAVAMEFLNWVGVPEIDVMTMSEEEVLAAIRRIRDVAPLTTEDVEMEDGDEEEDEDNNTESPRKVPEGEPPSQDPQDGDEPPAKKQRLE